MTSKTLIVTGTLPTWDGLSKGSTHNTDRQKPKVRRVQNAGKQLFVGAGICLLILVFEGMHKDHGTQCQVAGVACLECGCNMSVGRTRCVLDRVCDIRRMRGGVRLPG